jgi:hypothetical protein
LRRRTHIQSTGTGKRRVILREFIAASICSHRAVDGGERRRRNPRKGPIMPIDWEFNGALPARRWRNTITGECRTTPPLLGELDWVETTSTVHCPD